MKKLFIAAAVVGTALSIAGCSMGSGPSDQPSARSMRRANAPGVQDSGTRTKSCY
ncbi:MAG: hypothetical protein FWC61_04540 [Proteobacteria bacterium]|nr:hypothetical protein [Pseudomonadota bacterium]